MIRFLLLCALLQPLCGQPRGDRHDGHGQVYCGEELGHVGRHVAVTKRAYLMWGDVGLHVGP